MSENTLVLPLHSVHITRGKDVITVEVPKHEIAVLQVIHNTQAGIQHVQDMGPIEGETITLDKSTASEIRRLQGRYLRTGAPDPVPMAFRAQSELERYGFSEGGVPLAKSPQSGVKKHTPAKAEKGEGGDKGKSSKN